MSLFKNGVQGEIISLLRIELKKENLTSLVKIQDLGSSEKIAKNPKNPSELAINYNFCLMNLFQLLQ
jgi:hypothetical protein